MTAPTLLILPGDGIGPEVMAEVRRIIDWYGEKRGITFELERRPRGRGGLRRARHAAGRRDDGARAAGRRGAARRRGRAEIRRAGFLGEARARASAAAQGDGSLRQSAARPVFRRAGGFLVAEEGRGRGARHHDHPRADQRHLFRRAARASSPRATSGWASTPSATPRARSPAWRARPSSWPASARTRSARWRRPT